MYHDENEEDESPVAIDNGDDNEDYNDDHDFMDDEIPDTNPSVFKDSSSRLKILLFLCDKFLYTVKHYFISFTIIFLYNSIVID